MLCIFKDDPSIFSTRRSTFSSLPVSFVERLNLQNLLQSYHPTYLNITVEVLSCFCTNLELYIFYQSTIPVVVAKNFALTVGKQRVVDPSKIHEQQKSTFEAARKESVGPALYFGRLPGPPSVSLPKGGIFTRAEQDGDTTVVCL